MHKLRNTAHMALLNELFSIYGEVKCISKKEMRILLSRHNWNKNEVILEIENNTWWYLFIKD